MMRQHVHRSPIPAPVGVVGKGISAGYLPEGQIFYGRNRFPDGTDLRLREGHKSPFFLRSCAGQDQGADSESPRGCALEILLPTVARRVRYFPEGSTIKGGMAKEYIEGRDGNYYVTGTRISLDSIVHAFRRGESPETICQNFELLRLEEVYGAIAYYLANQADIDAYLIRQSEKWAEGRRDADPLPANLRERLMRARDELHTTRPS